MGPRAEDPLPVDARTKDKTIFVGSNMQEHVERLGREFNHVWYVKITRNIMKCTTEF